MTREEFEKFKEHVIREDKRNMKLESLAGRLAKENRNQYPAAFQHIAKEYFSALHNAIEEFKSIAKNSKFATIKIGDFEEYFEKNKNPEVAKYAYEQHRKELRKDFGDRKFGDAKSEFIYELTFVENHRLTNLSNLLSNIYTIVCESILNQQNYYYAEKLKEYKLDNNRLLEIMNEQTGKNWKIEIDPPLDDKLREAGERSNPFGSFYTKIKIKFSCEEESFYLKFFDRFYGCKIKDYIDNHNNDDLSVLKTVEALDDINWLQHYVFSEFYKSENDVDELDNVRMSKIHFLLQDMLLPSVITNAIEKYIADMEFVNCQVAIKDSDEELAKIEEKAENTMSWFNNFCEMLDESLKGNSKNGEKDFDTLLKYAIKMLGIKEIDSFKELKDSYEKQKAVYSKLGVGVPEFSEFGEIIKSSDDEMEI